MYNRYSSRYAKIMNPITGEIRVFAHELKEDKPFKPMYGRNIETDEIILDRRDEAYWKK